MNSLIRPFGAVALCGSLLVGCNAVQNVPNKDYTPLPTPTVVLRGTITGLSSTRSVTLEDNGDSAGALGFLAPNPALPTAGPPPVPFSFGALPQGSPYNITVKGSPFGKICTVANGSGTLTTADDLAAHAITVTCANDPAVLRYDLTVNLPTDPTFFSGLPSAAVNLKTEEQIYTLPVTSGQTSVTFPGVLFNATGQPNAFTWAVTANVQEANGTVDRCVLTGPTGSNPTGSVATPRVGTAANQTVSACKFTMSGSVAYNAPPGGTAQSMPSDGLTLDVRDTEQNVITQQTVTAYGAFTVGGATPVLFPSNSHSVYDIVVSRQPTGQTCVVGDSGGVNFYVGSTSYNPVSVTSTGVTTTGTSLLVISTTGIATANASGLALGSRLNVFCRATPATAKQLKGVFRLTSSTWTPDVTAATPAHITSNWTPYDLTVQNTASSNMLAFFDDGTFLYGTHALTPQVEHGFYDYDAVNKTLRFTLITDTNSSVTFPGNFAPTPSPTFLGATSLLTSTPGLSATPGKIGTTGVGTLNAAMTGVQIGSTTVITTDDNTQQTVRTISGTFGADAGASTSTTVNPAAVNGTTQYANVNQRLDWVLTEPKSIDQEMTGAWTSQDHRRFWVWDFSDYYGAHVGVEGGAASMNDACYTTQNLHASSGIYTRRGTSSGCYPFGRPATGQIYGAGFVESIDFNTATVNVPQPFNGALPTGFVALFHPGGSSSFGLPGFIGRLPGGQSAADGRSPSPIQFVIAPAASFFATADQTYFPEHFPDATSPSTSTSWCPTEILGIRTTSNDIPIDYPVYFCRTRAP